MSRTRRLRCTAALAMSLTAGTMAVTLAAPAAAAPAAGNGGATCLPDASPAPVGSIVLTPALIEGRLVVQARGLTDLEQSPLDLGNATRQRSVPEEEQYGFLGKPGVDFWVVGPGADVTLSLDGIAEDPSGTSTPETPGATTGDSAPNDGTTWHLDAVDGPGDLYVYQDTAGSPEPLIGSGPGWPQAARTVSQDPLTPTWAFTAPGHYSINLRVTIARKAEPTTETTQKIAVQVEDCTTPSATTPDDMTPSPATPPAAVHPTHPGPDGNADTPASTPTPAASAHTTANDTSAPSSRLTSRHTAKTAYAVPAADPTDIQTRGQDVACQSPAGAADGDSDGQGRPNSGTGSGSGAGTGSNPVGGSDDSPAAADVVRSGHFDFGAVIDGGRLDARIKDDRSQPPSWVAPATIDFALSNAAKAVVPSTAAYSFLGNPGDDVWILPQTQSSSLPWLGWNTQHETLRSQVTGPVTFTLDRISGPGKVAVFLNDSFGGVGDKKFGTATGFPRAFNVSLNVHAHGNWAFTEPGTYKITMTQSARLKSGPSVSDTATLTFRVGSAAAGRVAASANHLDTAESTRGATSAVAKTAITDTFDQTETATTCTKALGLTGAPDVSDLTAAGGLLILAGAAAVAGTVALNRRERAAGR